jgi:hypothetical protein
MTPGWVRWPGKRLAESSDEPVDHLSKESISMERFLEMNQRLIGATIEHMRAAQAYWTGVFAYMNEFMTPYLIAMNSFHSMEREKLLDKSLWETIRDYMELYRFNLQLAERGFISSFRTMNEYHLQKMSKALSAWLNTIFDHEGEDIERFMAGQARLLEKVVYSYPQAIRDIEAEYGLHLDDGGYAKKAETERFSLYQILPLDKKVKVREHGKPLLIVPPAVLGANILAFLPHENKSYVHCFANQGIPTYIRITKDIATTPAVQVMTGEDDVRDTRFFCEGLKARHGRPVTLNGFCQGGFMTLLSLLSGELDGLVDAHITCVAPIDGSRSKSLVEYLDHTPARFRDLGYAVKSLPNGNRVVDGKVMSWVFKLRSIEKEAPMLSFYRDLMMFDSWNGNGHEVKINKTAAALNHWLLYDRCDLPLAITKLSYDSYTIPVTEDGTLPVRLFGRKLNFKRLKDQGIKWLICYAEKDDLVDKASALAPLDFVDAEVCAFPKGHVSIATSWSNPGSQCALHTRFGGYRGPVRYHLDLEESV